MSAESDAALAELHGLKADLETLGSAISGLKSAVQSANSQGEADRQALVDLQSQLATIRSDIAALKNANGITA